MSARQDSKGSSEARPQVRIQDFYSDYLPPFDARAVVARLIDAVPAKYLRRLDAIVLTNQGSLSRDRRRSPTMSRKRKVRIRDAAGLYHQEWQGKPAWIEVFVDRIIGDSERSVRWRIPLVREMFVGEVVYHELGHHVHKVLRPEFREREDVADDWSTRFLSAYIRRNYWYLLPVAYLIKLVLRVGRALGLVKPD
ncbi:MAG TPA: hypothetical protein VLE48_09075 [Terriglobales bacterium]|nr:hypothetical protein [Terriglobales bacterium]